MNSALITGISSGLGLGLTETLLAEGWTVYGVSRRGAPLRHPRLIETWTDLAGSTWREEVSALLEGVDRLELVVLNAGLLGEIKSMTATTIAELESIMAINVWSNKQLLDQLLELEVDIGQVVAISSGAAVNGNYGWGGYALSKAALNMLMQLYAHEMPNTHLQAVAPGLIDTAMQDYLCEAVDPDQFPSVEKLRDSRGGPQMPGPEQAARALVSLLPSLRERPSGDFVDVRDALVAAIET